METIFFLMVALLIILVPFGIIYPLVLLLAYPVYRKCGGKKSIKEYMNSL